VTYGVKQYQAIGSDQIDSAATSFGTQEEYELLAFGVVEVRDNLGSPVDVHRTIETHAAIPTHASTQLTQHHSGYALLVATQLFHEVESLRGIADENNFIVCVILDMI
jgi:hypothetical protein